MASEKVATFGIRIPTETNADQSANSVEELGAAIKKSQEAIKGFSATLRALKGSSDEVKTAKEKLKAAIDAEKNAISSNVLALGKHGKSLGDVTKNAKEATKSIDDVKKAFSNAGGPLGTATEKLGGFQDLLAAVKTPAGGAALAIGLVVAAVAALGAGLVYGTIQLAKFILESGNLLRSQAIAREAFSGSAENAKAWGNQIEDMARRLPKTRAELNGLVNDLESTFGNSRVSEKAVVDLANAMGQVSIRGPEAAAELKAVFDQAKNGRGIALGINDLSKALGNNAFQDVAQTLAKNLKIGLNDAQTMLRRGLVPFDAGAKAFREVAEKRFGKLNLRSMLDLDVIGKKLKDTFDALTSGVNLEPILAGFQKLASMFDTSTVTGAALKETITVIGTILGKVFTAALPSIEAFFEEFEILGLELINKLLDMGEWFKKTLGIDLIEILGDADNAVLAAKVVFFGMAAAVVALGAAFALFTAPITISIGLIYGLWRAVKAAWEFIADIDWSALGKAIIDGLVNGLKNAAGAVWNAVKDIGTGIKDTFTDMLGIESPSTVFAGYGENTAEGYAQGVDSGKARAAQAVTDMATAPKGNAGSAGADAGGSRTLEAHFHFPNAKNGKDVTDAVTSASFKAEFTRVVEELLLGSGVATQTPQAGTT